MNNPDYKWSETSLETRLYIQHFVTEIPLSFEAFFYQTANYLNATSPNEKFSFYLFRAGDTRSVACIHFTKDISNIISPDRAPFGGIQFDENCIAVEMNFLLRCVENWFSTQSDCLLAIKIPPACYNTTPTNDLLTSAYQLSGYKITDKFSNYHIPISQLPFYRIITSTEAIRLTKCKKSGFHAGLYEKPDIGIVHDFINESRAAKGYLMTMTLEQLEISINNFPEKYRVFMVTDESKIIALTVTILVCKKILYNFLPADLPAYKSLSPMVYLTEAVYNYCQKEEIAILDLGISLDNNGNEKPGLLKFKKNLGGEKSFKVTYVKQLNSQAIPILVENS